MTTTPDAVERSSLSVEVNGEVFEQEVEVRLTLADFLREKLDLTGTHLGCEHGVCGACTVQIDGQAVRSCLTLAVQASGRKIRTIEGVSDGTELSPIQQAFWDHHGLQCGFCTPGMIIATEDLLRNNPSPSREEIREGMSGQICRCTGYQKIVDSIEAAAAVLRGEEPPPVPSTGSDRASTPHDNGAGVS